MVTHKCGELAFFYSSSGLFSPEFLGSCPAPLAVGRGNWVRPRFVSFLLPVAAAGGEY